MATLWPSAVFFKSLSTRGLIVNDVTRNGLASIIGSLYESTERSLRGPAGPSISRSLKGYGIAGTSISCATRRALRKTVAPARAGDEAVARPTSEHFTRETSRSRARRRDDRNAETRVEAFLGADEGFAAALEQRGTFV